jgi:hypothetical protein
MTKIKLKDLLVEAPWVSQHQNVYIDSPENKSLAAKVFKEFGWDAVASSISSATSKIMKIKNDENVLRHTRYHSFYSGVMIYGTKKPSKKQRDQHKLVKFWKGKDPQRYSITEEEYVTGEWTGWKKKPKNYEKVGVSQVHMGVRERNQWTHMGFVVYVDTKALLKAVVQHSDGTEYQN